MSRFFVGQRVVLARPAVPGNGGAQGHITHLVRYADGEKMPNGYFAREGMDCLVHWDRPLNLLIFSLEWTGCFLSQLEPILPDGHRPAEQGAFEPLDHLLSRLKGVEA